MLRKIYVFILSLLVMSPLLAQQGSGEIKGRITDKSNGEGLPYANVVAKKNGVLVTGTQTDLEGYYSIKPLDPGTYDIEANYAGFPQQVRKGVIVKGNTLSWVNFEMEQTTLGEVVVTHYQQPLIDVGGGPSGDVIPRENIQRMAARSATSVASTIAGVGSAGTGGGVSIRGARTDGNFYYIDGVKVRGSTNLPKGALQEVSVLTGGIPANFGDATSGIISITTRGPSSTYTGSIEGLSSGFKGKGLDPYSYNLIEGTFSGPLAFRKDADGKKTDPLAGFFLSLNYNHLYDQNPSIIGYYRLDPDKYDEIAAHPYSFGGFPTAENPIVPINSKTNYLTRDNFENIKTGQGIPRSTVAGTARFDINLSKTALIAIGGNFNFLRDRQYSFVNTLFNSDNNGLRTNLDWRTFARFTQRFTSEAESKASIKNVYYSINFDYSKSKAEVMNADHKKDFFSYGYVGKFDIIPSQTRLYNDIPDTLPDGTLYFRQAAVIGDSVVLFTPGTKNPILANYTSDYFALVGDSIVQNRQRLSDMVNRGLRNGDAPAQVYGLWNNIGSPFGGYGKSNNSQYRATAVGSADIGHHAFSIGFEYEQRVDRAYNLSNLVTNQSDRTNNIWARARQLTNNHLLELNTYDTNLVFIGGNYYWNMERTPYGGSSQSFFDKNLRKALGLDPQGTDYINIDALNPEQLSLDYFSAPDLIQSGNNALVDYYGYDHKGNKLNGKPSLEDFFNQVDLSDGRTYKQVIFDQDSAGKPIPRRDANGKVMTYDTTVYPRTYARGAFEPIYFAGFIMDKFAFNDILFNIGLRVDRYDANQKVLKDKYLFREAHTVSSMPEFLGPIPGNIGGDYVVYVDDENDPKAIKGFRKGDVFYNASGKESDPSAIRGTSKQYSPYLVDPSSAHTPLTPGAFTDYVPQVNLMPRIAFTFPISDEAVFSAHYDILTRRPPSNARLDLMDYYFIRTRNSSPGSPISNPDLKPEKTIDYEVGFQQKLTSSSSLKLAVFYREQRDMIQVVYVEGAYPQSYHTLGNIDFGTIKGMTVSYDLRKTGKTTMKVNYTLQFADGTGSGVGGVVNLLNTQDPTLRTINPYDFDQRHKINAVIDYRYGSGTNYDGPKLFGKDILSNTGFNFTVDLGSGTPYSASTRTSPITNQQNALEGSINGSRLPWRFRTDLQVDKDIPLTFKKGEGEDEAKGNLNVYVSILNLFQNKIVNSVYRATGNPDDDGYLNDFQWQNQIRTQINEQAYRDMYALRLLNGGNYDSPRMVRLGVRLDF